MRNACVIESIIEREITVAGRPTLKVRVWRTETEINVYEMNTDVLGVIVAYQAILVKADDTFDFERRHKLFIEELCELPRVSAVQIINGFGHGVVVYTEWP